MISFRSVLPNFQHKILLIFILFIWFGVNTKAASHYDITSSMLSCEESVHFQVAFIFWAVKGLNCVSWDLTIRFLYPQWNIPDTLGFNYENLCNLTLVMPHSSFLFWVLSSALFVQCATHSVSCIELFNCLH